LTENLFFLYGDILHDGKPFLREKRFSVLFRPPFFGEFYQINRADCHFYKNIGFPVSRMTIFPGKLAFPSCRTPVFFFRRHSASRKTVFPGSERFLPVHATMSSGVYPGFRSKNCHFRLPASPYLSAGQ
jgi:hypothetical protein